MKGKNIQRFGDVGLREAGVGVGYELMGGDEVVPERNIVQNHPAINRRAGSEPGLDFAGFNPGEGAGFQDGFVGKVGGDIKQERPAQERTDRRSTA